MKIFFNGDSHTIGTGVPTKDTFAEIVASNFSAECVNHAKEGASNARILRTTHAYLFNEQPDLVVIGWSSWEREEWQYLGNYYDVNSSGHHALPEPLADLYKKWVTEQDDRMIEHKSVYWHAHIFKLHLDLLKRQIPHVFFNCMYDFKGIGKEFIWGSNYIGPYDSNSSYYWYLKNAGYIADEWYHYAADGHKAWADVLSNQLAKLLPP
jgi:hypothetical protein